MVANGVAKRPLTLLNDDLADVYAPRILPGQRDQLADTFPIITILQGANVDKANYAGLGRALARRGFVVAIPNHVQAIPGTDVTGLFAEVHVVTEVLAQLAAEDADRRSWLYRIVDTERMGLIGHSFGGGRDGAARPAYRP